MLQAAVDIKLQIAVRPWGRPTQDLPADPRDNLVMRFFLRMITTNRHKLTHRRTLATAMPYVAGLLDDLSTAELKIFRLDPLNDDVRSNCGTSEIAIRV